VTTPSRTRGSPERTTRRKPALANQACRALIRLLVGAACFSAGSSQGTAAETPASKEYQIKAAFVYNFTKFVEWPPNSFDDPDAPIVIAVAGKGPCAAEVERSVKDRTVNGRQILVKTVETPGAAKGAHVLFLSASEDSRLEEWLGAFRSAGTLTVGESEPFAKAGGIIRFVLEGDKVRFEINIDSAERAGLKVSAQLQKLAKSIRKQKC
jgi:hypothetical protein